MSESLEIPCPTRSEVRKYLKIWDSDKNYREPAKALQKLFTKYLPTNKHIEDILVKTHALNDAFNTGIYWPVDVAENILAMKIDNGLPKGDMSVIEKITKKDGKEKFKFKSENGAIIKREFYVFATKYASFHQPDKYPIFDSNVERGLIHFRNNYPAKFIFNDRDLRIYEKFVDIIKKFQKSFDLCNFTFREIDKYLYLVGRKLNGF